MNPDDLLGSDLWGWMKSIPEPMNDQIEGNTNGMMRILPETPDSLEAAFQMARMNVSLAASLAEQIGGEYVDETDSIWRLLSALAMQNLHLMVAIDKVRNPIKGDQG